jgi:hypothetical protein
MSIEKVRGELTEAFDRLLASRNVFDEIEKTATGILEHAKPVSALIKQKRLPVEGATMRDIEIGIAEVDSFLEGAKQLLGSAEAKAKECSGLVCRLEVYSKTGTHEGDVTEAYDEFSKSLWFLKASTEELQALRALIEGSAASLHKLLPL